MTACIKTIKTFASILFLCVLAACTSSNIEQDLAAQPTISQAPLETQTPSTAVSETAQTAETNALASQTATTPTQAVTESQLQQQTTTQVEASGLASQGTNVTAPSAAQQVASLDTSKAMTFLPFEGAPQTKTASLTRLLNQSAQTNGLTILPATRTGAKYRVKGYFSALNDGNGTLLVYVWDVVDGTGKRLHRINGRERTGKSKTDPWQAITDTEMQKVASATTARLKTWVDKR